MQGKNVVEKFDNSRKAQRNAMKNESRQDTRKRNKTKRGNNRWDETEDQF